MIIAHRLCPDSRDRLIPHTLLPGEKLPDGVAWIDLLEPTKEEDLQLEA
jgi:magnesium transporter